MSKFKIQMTKEIKSSDVIEFAKALPNTSVNRSLISQVVRSGTSIGANYMEADAAESKKDFRHKKEVRELTLIFSAIVRNKND